MNKYIFIVIYLFSCSNKNPNLIGNYKSEPLSIIQKIYNFNNSDIRGLKLTLSKDSTFHYNACGLIFDGKWSVKQQKLYLTVENHLWKSKEIEKANQPFQQRNNPDFFIYEIQDDGLLSFIEKENRTVIIQLVKKSK